MPRLVMSPENPNRPSETDVCFVEGGVWERQSGRKLTRRLTKCFVKHVQIPLSGAFTLLDVGCALGDALPILHRVYPQARLTGCDVSANAVRRCKAEHGRYASFFLSSVHELSEPFDVIFCSNIIEHIENHVEIVDHLTTLAPIVYVMVPYKELHNGQPLNPKLGLWHVATFDEHTFDSLRNDRLEIRTTVYHFGRPAWRIPIAKARAMVFGPPYVDTKQIVYELKRVS